MAKQEPMLMESPLTKRVFVVTSYEHMDDDVFIAKEKYDVTGQFDRLAELRNARVARTCHCEISDEAWCFSCSACGKSFPRNELCLAHNHGEINFCPNCGRKVVKR